MLFMTPTCMNVRNIVLAVAVFVCSCTPESPKQESKTELAGEVFIATKEGENIKLGLVDIRLYDPGIMYGYVKERIVLSRRGCEC